MARALRIERVGGRFHATARGNERKNIFRDDTDRFHFLELLSEMPERFGVALHAYALMDYHYHLLMETPEANLSRAMQWLGSATACGSTGGMAGSGTCSRGASRRVSCKTITAGRNWRATCT